MGGPKALFRQSTVFLWAPGEEAPSTSQQTSVAPPLTIRRPLALPLLLLQSPGRGPCRWLPATANWRRTVPEREGTAGVGVQDRVSSAF